jgi:hypothetical protein
MKRAGYLKHQIDVSLGHGASWARLATIGHKLRGSSYLSENKQLIPQSVEVSRRARFAL